MTPKVSFVKPPRATAMRICVAKMKVNRMISMNHIIAWKIDAFSSAHTVGYSLPPSFMAIPNAMMCQMKLANAILTLMIC